jgi:hypothetical protein
MNQEFEKISEELLIALSCKLFRICMADGKVVLEKTTDDNGR